MDSTRVVAYVLIVFVQVVLLLTLTKKCIAKFKLFTFFTASDKRYFAIMVVTAPQVAVWKVHLYRKALYMLYRERQSEGQKVKGFSTCKSIRAVGVVLT